MTKTTGEEGTLTSTVLLIESAAAHFNSQHNCVQTLNFTFMVPCIVTLY